MGTNIRPEISKKKKYWISKHRYYELKHFCLQYKEWIDIVRAYDGYPSRTGIAVTGSSEWGDPTYICAKEREACLRKIDMVRKAAKEASDEIGDYIFKAVTEDLSFTCLKMMHDLPCGKDMFYDRYRKFWYILSRLNH